MLPVINTRTRGLALDSAARCSPDGRSRVADKPLWIGSRTMTYAPKCAKTPVTTSAAITVQWVL